MLPEKKCGRSLPDATFHQATHHDVKLPSPVEPGEGLGVRASATISHVTLAPPSLLLETTVNSRAVTLEIEPRAILLDVLRDRLGLTGAKRSCDAQVCGACTVLLDGLPVSACCTLAFEAAGRAVETIEGLSGPDGLHPIQQAFVDNAAIQCGFCTPGFVLTAKALLAENPHPSRAEIEEYLGGNLCRCTGYWNILAAVEDAARRLVPDEHKDGGS
jgi:aerobic-type carbon monoxide dehydrogenase small subunit (CoxS/CutS family)